MTTNHISRIYDGFNTFMAIDLLGGCTHTMFHTPHTIPGSVLILKLFFYKPSQLK